MARSEFLRRLLVVALVLLTVTPESVLRPCCCSQRMIDASVELAANDFDSFNAPEGADEAVCDAASRSSKHETIVISSASVASTTQSKPPLKQQTLSPCCQKRLQKSLHAALHAASGQSANSAGQCIVGANAGLQDTGTTEAVAQLAEGLSDGNCCKCGTLTQTPRVERVVFRTLAENWIAIDSLSSVSAIESSVTTHGDLFSNFDSVRNLLRPQSQRLCRWII